MYTCIDGYVYMHENYAYMQDDYVYIITWYLFRTSQNVCSVIKYSWSGVPSGPP